MCQHEQCGQHNLYNDESDSSCNQQNVQCYFMACVMVCESKIESNVYRSSVANLVACSTKDVETFSEQDRRQGDPLSLLTFSYLD